MVWNSQSMGKGLIRKAWPWSQSGLSHWAQLLIQSCGLCLWETMLSFRFWTLCILSNWKVSVALVVLAPATTSTRLQLYDDAVQRHCLLLLLLPFITTILYCILTCASLVLAQSVLFTLSHFLHDSLQDAIFLTMRKLKPREAEWHIGLRCPRL